MSLLDPVRQEERRRARRATIIPLAICILILFGIIFSQAAFNLSFLPFLRPDTNQEALILVALSALIFLLLLGLTFVLLRTLLKLYAERQTGVLGSRFRTKMVLGALVLSLGPVIFMFLFSYGLMNRSIDKWFSRPVEEVREHSAAVTDLLTNYAGQNANAEAASIAASNEVIKGFRTPNYRNVLDELRRREPTLQGGFVFALKGDDAQVTFHAPEEWSSLRKKLPSLNEPAARSKPFEYSGREYMLGVAAVEGDGRIVVAMPLPTKYSNTLAELDQSQTRYMELSRERKLVRRTYMGLLLFITVLVLFAATWFALFLAKLVTRPVSALMQATQEISRGRLDYRVEVQAGDEIGLLVDNFNRMAGELEKSRQQIEESNREIAAANVELGQQRRHIETILETIPTGVLSLDADRRSTRANDAFVRVFAGAPADGSARKTASGASLHDIFPEEVATDLDHMLRKADRMGSTSSQMEIDVPGRRMTFAVTVASLDPPGVSDVRARLGSVIVFEDLSDLLRAQKQSAWREVARRVAHEIKNPLTPIALSAERIRRHLDRGVPPDDSSLAVIHGCSETIAGAVETLRSLVDEFSTLARFPTAHPKPVDINQVVDATLAMFNGRLEGVRVRTHLAPDLPPVMADAEAMKRALANLVDNAAEAMKDSPLRDIQIGTGLVSSRDAVEVSVADTGHGVTAEVKERLFMPYFSTKQRGTGLGLAIVSRIVEDHRGSIRVEENKPMGSRFIIELPVAQRTDSDYTSSESVHKTVQS